MDSSKQSLLLVEDSSSDEALSLRAIYSSGVPCQVNIIRHGIELINSLPDIEKRLPDLIVLDFHLPGLNGLEILRELRKNERTRRIPIVMLSALESEKEILDCIKEGANSCVRKPMDPTVYIEHVALIAKYWLTLDKRPEETP